MTSMLPAEREPWSRAALIATAVLALVIVVAIVVANAPANWLARYVESKSGGLLLLADAQGTIWSGSAVVALGEAEGGPLATPPRRLALPGRVNWTLEGALALAPVLHLTQDDVLLQPVAVHFGMRGVAVDPGSAVLPASLLRLVGAPLNTLSPEGRCTLRWDRFALDADGRASGEGSLRVDGFALALSPVRPLGDYLVSWTASATGFVWSLATEHGPLAMDGNGTVGRSGAAAARVVLRAANGVPANVVQQLGPLLDLVGRRGTNEAIISTGAS